MASKPLLFILLLILPLTLAQPPPPPPPPPSPKTEQQTLLQIKKDWGNPAALTSWKTSTRHCDWTGILCTSGTVTQLNLTNQNIVNAIPSSVCQLTNLSVIDLSYNYIPGKFPTDLYNCTNLQHLDISQNNFVGPIPSDIDQLSHQLTYLSLSANNFSGDIPASIGKLTNLQYLFLDNNCFDGTFPAEIGNLSNLLRLYLASNTFAPRQIPGEYGKLTKLEWLWMSKTNVYGEIPVSLGNLKNLVHLSLDQNSLSGSIPSGIWMLEKLKILYLWYNQLTGEINATIGATSLVELDVSMNKLTGQIPEGFGGLKNLSVLKLMFNKLTGEIPASIGLLPLLVDIRMFNNNLTGVLPPQLGKHSRLYNFEVNNNQLSGELPQFLCDGGNFIYLGASDNNFTGNLPSSLGNCPTLIEIQVQQNNLTGEIPAGIWTNSVNLTTVIINHNSISGTLPEKLPQNLAWLDVESNQLSGNIPSSAQNLAVFKGSNNLFSGALPTNLAVMSRLLTLHLGGNQISGVIPDSISSLTLLTDLNMSRNHLSGAIPATIGLLPVLTTLDLSDNQLTGTIPTQMGNLNFIALNLSSNDISGEIPFQLQNKAYDESFLSNPKLCSSTSLLKIPVCSNQPSRSISLSTGLLVLFVVRGVMFFIGAVVLGVFLLRKRKRRNIDRDPAPSKLTSFHIVEFNESNIEKGLTDDNLIGSGGGGLVYKIALGNQAGDTVAVKKIWNIRKLDSKPEKEFEAEVEILGTIRHANIVKLLCCISSSDSKLLVYEYMENGSLDRWLHVRRRAIGRPMGRLGSGRSIALDWPRRLEIAIGAAKGLCYMHHDCSSPIVHRDVKSSNILLDSELNAKIADFGLARLLVKSGEPEPEPESGSAIAGSFGYMAPECQWLRKVNEKVDVYSFGVVLLELTTGKEPNGENSCLAEYVWHHIREGGTIEDIMDEEIKGPSYIEEIGLVLQLGIICTATSPADRPSMKEVLQVLQRCNQMIENGWVKPLGFGEYAAAPLLQNKRGSHWKKTLEVAAADNDVYVDSYV